MGRWYQGWVGNGFGLGFRSGLTQLNMGAGCLGSKVRGRAVMSQPHILEDYVVNMSFWNDTTPRCWGDDYRLRTGRTSESTERTRGVTAGREEGEGLLSGNTEGTGDWGGGQASQGAVSQV